MKTSRVILISGWAYGKDAMANLGQALSGTNEVCATSLPELLQETQGSVPPAFDNAVGSSTGIPPLRGTGACHAPRHPPESPFKGGLSGAPFLESTTSPSEDHVETAVSPYARGVGSLLSRVDGKACLVGWSTGGMVAIEAAMSSPGKIAALVLLAATPRFCSGEDYRHGVPEASLRAMRRGLRRNPEGILGDFFRRASLPRGISDEERTSKTRNALSLGSDVLAHGLDYLQSTDLRSALEGIVHPSLVIHGTEDRIIPWQAGELLSRNLPRCTASFLPDIGHTLIEQSGEDLVHRIRRFLENLP